MQNPSCAVTAMKSWIDVVLVSHPAWQEIHVSVSPDVSSAVHHVSGCAVHHVMYCCRGIAADRLGYLYFIRPHHLWHVHLLCCLGVDGMANDAI